MAKGLPKWAIKEAKRRGAKNIFAYAWTLVKRKKRTKRSSTTRRKSNPNKRRSRKVTRKKKRKGGGKSLMRTVEKYMAIGAFLAPGVVRAIPKRTWQEKFAEFFRTYSGYDAYNQKFDFGHAVQGWAPFLTFIVLSKGAHKLSGIIRRI